MLAKEQFLCNIFLAIFNAIRAVMWGREPPDAMSPRYADTSLPDLLGRPNLRYAVMSMRNTSKCACVIQEVFLTLCFKFK